MMRKLVTVLVAAATFLVVLTGTASAGGVRGYYRSEAICLGVAKKFAKEHKVRVGPCFKNARGWYFKYS